MASAKRKQDEKHLKILRELVSQTSNRECFDCRQRGPTYVNMTIGSFVCTSCSGMLRGLTPPHRVKSISMATFTQEEIDFVKEHGNERCKRIWLGLKDSESAKNLDSKDEQKLKDLMRAKYERKRWYLDPSFVDQNTDAKSEASTTTSGAQSSVPRVPRAASSAGVTSRRNKNATEATDAFAPDFVADFGKLADPFQAAATTWRLAQPILPQPSFANFDNNPAFDSSNGAYEPTNASRAPNLPRQCTTVPVASGTDAESARNHTSAGRNSANVKNGVTFPPSEDRYAALKDLDSLMKRAQLKEDNATVTPVGSPWITNNANANAPNSLWPSNDQARSRVIANPFVADLWRTSPAANILNNNAQPGENALACNSVNPFRTSQLASSNESQWIGIGSANVAATADVIPSSQLTTSNAHSGKVWQPSASTYRANPFTVGTGLTNVARNSNNPFL